MKSPFDVSRNPIKKETYYRKTKGSIGIEIKAQDGNWEMHGENGRT